MYFTQRQYQELTIKSNSSLSLKEIKVDQETVGAVLTLLGPAAKLPSVSNSRAVGRVRTRDGKMRTVSRKKDGDAAILGAMTQLFHDAATGPLHLNDSTNNRLIVVAYLGKQSSRFDSHNIPKGLCDWLQHNGVIKNDRNVDCFAQHKSETGVKFDSWESTSILMIQYKHIQNVLGVNPTLLLAAATAQLEHKLFTSKGTDVRTKYIITK